MLPDTAVEFAFIDGRIDVIGPMTVARPGRYAIGGRVQLLSLDPIIASSWLGVPMALLADRVVNLRDIDPSIAEKLAESFANGRVADQLARAFAALEPDARAAHAAALLARGISVSRTAAAANLGDRQFTRWFHQRTGMHPKRYQRVERVRRAVLVAKQGQPLAAAAADAGYVDQAHFNRDVNALIGAAPRTILPNVGNVQDLAVPLG